MERNVSHRMDFYVIYVMGFSSIRGRNAIVREPRSDYDDSDRHDTTLFFSTRTWSVYQPLFFFLLSKFSAPLSEKKAMNKAREKRTTSQNAANVASPFPAYLPTAH